MRICLVTSEHISANPRLVKEADALYEAGHDVRVVACQWQRWNTNADSSLLSTRRWRYHFLNWSRQCDLRLFWLSRLRQRVAQHVLARFTLRGGIAERAISRVIPELARIAGSEPADLFIGHNIGALAAATGAARKHGARVGFDAEDFHSGMGIVGAAPSVFDAAAEHIERKFLPACIYITAGAPEIATAYAVKYRLPPPTTILNVFPLSQRPLSLRPSNEQGPLTLYWFSQTIGACRGLEDIIQAIGSLPECRIELHLRGRWQPGYREELFRFSAAAGVRPDQIVAHELAPPDEMVRLAAPYDAGLALEHAVSENRDICLTNKIFTYMLGGNAILATATRGQRPLMETIGDAGYCYTPGDIRALARQIEHWYQDRASLQAARHSSWEWGTRRYNWDLEKIKFLQVIEGSLSCRVKQAYEYSADRKINLGQSRESRQAPQEDT